MKTVLFSSSIGDIPCDLAFKNNYAATVAPGVNDDSSAGYQIGSTWVIPASKIIYECVDATEGAADWIVVSSNEQTPGQVVAPPASTPTGTGGNASLTGGAGGSTSGSGGTASVVGGDGTAGDANGGDAIIQGGSADGTGVDGVVKTIGVVIKSQGAPAAITAGATLTPAQLLAGIVTGNLATGAGGNYQLPLAADLDDALPTVAADQAFDFSLINISTVAAEDITVTTNTGWTLVGNMVVASNAVATDQSVATFRARRTATDTWTLYRIA